MLRQAFLYLSNQQKIFRFVRNNRFAKRLAQRFVAGETLEEAIRAIEPLNKRGITASLDLLGESVHTEREAQAATREILTMLDRINESRAQANVSLKLTQMGLDLSEELCVGLMHDVVGRARDLGTFIRIDMEDSAYTERTLRLFEDRLHPSYGDHVGIVLQSYLYRTLADVERAIAIRARVRLCKGAYKEPATVAYPEKADVDANYVRCMHKLLTEGNYPALATHDDRIIKEATRYVRANGIAADRFEFQMLYGVRRDLQDRLVREGWRVRVYVPFGTQWYPYLMRRLAERPSNIAFITGNVVREMIRR
ncbi:MAG TPA: proline dehydrogenase family protein [Gemmatimonadaceae bacterium]|jgi:proline dehydrogenase|nr:proline dehydrogenase family protein [Gemmatimonadaceae bacterium]